MDKKYINIKSILIVIVSLHLIACNEDATSPTSPVKTHMSGSTAGGALVNALVCLDANSNHLCDSGELSSSTDSKGDFVIEGITKEQSKYYVVLEVIEGETIDSSVPVSKSYSLRAPSSFQIINPFTTLVQHEIDKGYSLNSSKIKIQNLIGISFDLSKDYIEQKNTKTVNNNFKSESEKLSNIATVITHILSDNIEKLKSTAKNNGITFKKLNKLITEEIINNLGNIVNKENNSVPFDLKSIVDDINDNYIKLTPDNMLDRINGILDSESENTLEIVKKEGINWFSSIIETLGQPGPPVLYRGVIKLNNNTVVDQRYIFVRMKREFRAIGPTSGGIISGGVFILGKNGWTPRNDNIVDIEDNQDGSIEIVKVASSLNQVVKSVKSSDISNLNVHSVLSKIESGGLADSFIFDNDLLFPPNSTAYKLDISYTDGGYYMLDPDLFTSRNRCIEPSDLYTFLNDMCNGLEVYKGGATTTWLTSLDSTISVSSSNISGWMPPIIDLLPIASSPDREFYAQLLSNGTVNYYFIKNEMGSRFVKVPDSGHWEDIKVKNKVLRKIVIPNFTLDGVNKTIFNKNDNTLYLTVHNGFVRIISLETNSVFNFEDAFDKKTTEFLLDNIKKSQPLPYIKLL